MSDCLEVARYFSPGWKRGIYYDIFRILGMGKRYSQDANRGVKALYRDRFNFFNKFSDLNWSQKTDYLENSDISFEECCLNRVEALIKLYPNEQFNIMYSGGIDSCGIVSAFADHLDKICVYVNEFSVDENPKFFEWIKRNNVNYRFVNHDNTLKELAYSDGIILNGHTSDQYFGHKVSSIIAPDLNNLSVADAVQMIKHERRALITSSADEVESAAIEYGKHLGMEIKDFKDLILILDFGLKYTYAKEHINFDLHEIKENKFSIPFYDSQDFNNWCFSNFDEIKQLDPHDLKQSKRPLKEFIENRTGFSDIWTIPKKNSWTFKKYGDRRHLWVKTESGYKYFTLTDEFIESLKRKRKFIKSSTCGRKKYVWFKHSREIEKLFLKSN